MPPLEPREEQDRPVKRGSVRKSSNRERVLRAIELLGPTAVSFSQRRAHGCSIAETDAMQRVVEDCAARLRSVSETLARGARVEP